MTVDPLYDELIRYIVNRRVVSSFGEDGQYDIGDVLTLDNRRPNNTGISLGVSLSVSTE